MKRFKARKRISLGSFKLIICILIIIFSFIITIKYIYKVFVKNNREDNIKEMLSISSNNIIGDISLLDLVNFNLKSPDSLLKMNFSNASKLKYEVSEKKVIEEVKEPLIYIYNTHQTEEYASGTLREYNITPTVFMASNILSKTLKNNGISSVVEETNIKKSLNERGLSYGDSYVITRDLLNNINSKYPSIKYYMDVHRDSSSGTITINDKVYAKMMFVVGMNHDNYKLNEELMVNINNYLNEHYEGVMRDIFYGKRSKYNQDFNPNTILIEIGGPDNTIDEIYNSVLILGEAISNVIRGV